MKKTDTQKIESSFEEKFGKKIASTNYTQIPNVLFFRRRLGLTYSDFYFVCFVFSKKYGKEWPYFSLNKMGRELNMPPGTRNDVIKRLRRNKYLETPPVVEKYKGKGRNCYILEGLLTALEYFIDCGIRITKDQSKKENNHKSTGEIKNIAELIKKKNMDFI